MFRRRASVVSSKSSSGSNKTNNNNGHYSSSVLGGRASSHSSNSASHNHNGNGTSGGGGGSVGGSRTTHHAATPVLIQRLIILHDGMMPLPRSKKKHRSSKQPQQQQQRRRNPQLSEDASLEEHGEFILYYYDHSLHFSQEGRSRIITPPPTTKELFKEPTIKEQQRQPRRHTADHGNESSDDASAQQGSSRGEKPTPTPPDYATEEAVRFAGVCRALRSLPLALQSESCLNEEMSYNSQNSHHSSSSSTKKEAVSETNVVHLKESTLVFVPLELGGDIVAVAQIPRGHASQERSRSQRQRQQSQGPVGFGANPSAIEEAMKHIHAAFSLLFGGGIHRRLLRTKHLERSKDWVLEVVEDDEKEEDNHSVSNDSFGSHRRDSFGSHRRDSFSSRAGKSLKMTDDSTWEMEQLCGDSIDSKSLKLSEVWEVSDQVESVEKVDFSPIKVVARRRKSRQLKKLSSSITFDGNSINFAVADTDGQSKRRNLDDPCSSRASSGDYRYGGMEELFNLRRERRKLKKELGKGDSNKPAASGGRFGGLAKNSRWGSNSNAEDLFNDIANDFGHNDCERRIENLLNLLPITKLRKDLVKFYDERLCQLQGVCEIMRGGAGRCVVELVPSPISRGIGNLAGSGPVRGQHPPYAPVAFVCLAAAEFMKSLMHEDIPKLKGQSLMHQDNIPKLKSQHGRLFGMSLFYKDRLVVSEVLPPNGNKNGGEGSIASEILNFVAEHLRSSGKMHNGTTKSSADPEKLTHNTNHTPLSRWMSGLSVGKNDDMVEEAHQPPTQKSKKKYDTKDPTETPGYVDRIPSTNSADGPADSLLVDSLKKHIWLPRVHLPSYDSETETHVAMFESQELSFLLFFEMPGSAEGEDVLAQMAEELQPKGARYGNHNLSNATLAFTEMVIFASDRLTEFCNSYNNSHEMDPISEDAVPTTNEFNSESIFPGELGMDIIYIDRDEGSFVLMSQHDLSSNEFKRMAPKGEGADDGSKPKGFGLFGMGPKPKEMNEEVISRGPSQYTNVLDCRHKLAAYLPLDVMLAFDDMFNEIGHLSYRKDVLNPTATDSATASHVNNDMSSTKSIELCTFLPQGWVYGRAFCNIELYILLDTSKFVTINDVQKAVTRVRERLFNDKIR